MIVPALVLHVDMDAFFASVEVRSDPRLAGKPLVVGGGPGKRGVVTTASYPAREFGVRSGMPLVEALRRCPDLLVLPVDPRKVIHESLTVLAVLDRISSRVEAASIDEAYLSLPAVGGGAWEARAREVGEAVRREIRRARGLPCSVGAAVNKLQAKMTTRLAKPDGLAVLPPDRFGSVFFSQPASTIPGVGPRAGLALEGLGIRTVGDLAGADPAALRACFGRWGELLRGHARGEDPRAVVASGEEPDPKSAGHETTFALDVDDPGTLRAAVWMLADRVGRRLRSGGYAAGTVAVRFKVGRDRMSRQKALAVPTDLTATLALTAWRLLEGARGGRALRLVGVAGCSLVRPPRDESLFPEDRRARGLVAAGDRIRDRFGEKAILPAGVFLGEE
jgi:nucleotidyltransferase/DNA polymerase involved in DNA repair